MAGESVKQNTITYNAALSACETALVWSREAELLAAMADAGVEQCTTRLRPFQQQQQRQWHGAADSACEKGGEWLQRDAIIYSAAVSACGMVGSCG